MALDSFKASSNPEVNKKFKKKKMDGWIFSKELLLMTTSGDDVLIS